MKVNLIKGPMLETLRKEIYQDFASSKKKDFLNRDLPKVVNK